MNKQYEAVQILVSAGADINLQAQDGTSPLSMAREQEDNAMLALLTGKEGEFLP